MLLIVISYDFFLIPNLFLTAPWDVFFSDNSRHNFFSCTQNRFFRVIKVLVDKVLPLFKFFSIFFGLRFWYLNLFLSCWFLPQIRIPNLSNRKIICFLILPKRIPSCNAIFYLTLPVILHQLKTIELLRRLKLSIFCTI